MGKKNQKPSSSEGRSAQLPSRALRETKFLELWVLGKSPFDLIRQLVDSGFCRCPKTEAEAEQLHCELSELFQALVEQREMNTELLTSLSRNCMSVEVAPATVTSDTGEISFAFTKIKEGKLHTLQIARDPYSNKLFTNPSPHTQIGVRIHFGYAGVPYLKDWSEVIGPINFQMGLSELEQLPLRQICGDPYHFIAALGQSDDSVIVLIAEGSLLQ